MSETKHVFAVEAIGYVHNDQHYLVDEGWGSVQSVIKLDTARFDSEAVAGLDEFSHLEIVFLLHRVPLDSIVTGARHPRGDLTLPRVGIFAQRAKHRPNRIGVSTCRLERIEVGPRLIVRGLDAIDGTPVLDVKPYMREFAPHEVTRQPAWAVAIMKGYF